MDVTDEIKARIDIVDFISRYTPLKRAGRSYKANCPFHEERTPSFVVFPETGTWRCFGACAAGGDVFSFLMKQENLDFREALHILAKEAGVDLETEEDDTARKERTRLYEAHVHAAQFYRDQLHRSPAAQNARHYLKNRGIDAATAEMFQLGFAPDSWDALLTYLTELDYTIDELLKAGLIKRNESGTSQYDAFRNRVMIPINDRQGRVIGFGGRVLGDGIPKYLNTSDTPLFNKSATVYGLDRAYKNIREQDAVVIVEGYMDVIAAHQFGHENVVACLGTALTEDQLKQLQRYTNNYILALDSDAAGQQATIRGLNQARQALKRVRKPVLTPSGRVRMESRLAANLRIVALPSGKDPDELIRKSSDLWQETVAAAQPLVDYYMNVVTAQADLSTAQGKAEMVGELVPLVAELEDDIERQHYVQQLSRLVQIDEQTIRHRVDSAARTLSHEIERQKTKRKKESYTKHTASSEHSDRQKPAISNSELATKMPSGSLPPDLGGEEPAREDLTEDNLVGADPFTDAAFRDEMLPTEDPDWDNESWDSGQADIDSKLDTHQSTDQQRVPAFFAGTDPTLERFLLAQLLQEPNLLVWMAGAVHELEIVPLKSDELERAEHREIFITLKRFLSSDEVWDMETFQEQLEKDLHGTLAYLVQHAASLPERDYSEMQEAVLKALIRLRLERLKMDLSTMNFLLQDAQQNNDRDAIFGYSAAINANRRERHHLEKVLVRINRVSFGPRSAEQGIRIA